MSSDLTPVPDDLAGDATIRALDSSQLVFGRYILKRILGRGGMGIVWLAYDDRLDREVALKFLPEEVYFDPGALDDLKRETRRCLDLTHPNIVRIYDFISDEKAAAISMEFVDGKTLSALRVEKESRIFEVGEIKGWITQVCRALQYAHEEAGVVHRDLKPANLMLSSRGQIKIADFGIAQSMGESMSRRTLRQGSSGTLAYMSPQQLNGDASRATDDIYAMGATIYELLTGKPPFASGDIPFQVRVQVPRTMADRRREAEISGQVIPREWEETVAACLSKAPEERPRSMMELLERLTRPSTPLTPPAIKPAPTAAGDHHKPAPRGVRLVLPPLWVTQRLFFAGAAAALSLLVLWLVWAFGIAPLLAKPGELQLTSAPPGATVHIWGQSDRMTPASFPRLRPGVYRMTLSSPGFAPLQEKVKIVSDKTTDLGTLQLERTVGSVHIVTVPTHVHFVLVGAANTGSFQQEGTTPVQLSKLPTGSYTFTLSAPGFPSYSGNLEVASQAAQERTCDLTQLALVGNTSTDAARVFRGEMDAGKLDRQGQAQLLDLENKAFEQYLEAGLFASAAGQLAKLKALGAKTDLQQARLTEKSAAVENELAGRISHLIAEERYATAGEKLKNMGGVLEPASLDTLSAEFQAPLAAYRQQIDAAIQTSRNQPPADASPPLKALLRKHPDDLDVQMALADIQMRLPPDHDRLTARLNELTRFSVENKDFANDPRLLADQAAFTSELQQFDTLSAALDAARNGPENLRRQLAALQYRKEAMEDTRVGRPKSNPFSQTINFFGKAVTGHTVVGNAPYFPTEEDKADAIANVQSQIDQDKLSLAQPPATSDDAQKRYDAFMTQVPWGPGHDSNSGAGSAPPAGNP